MKKLTAAALALVTALLMLTGCLGSKDVEGGELIKKAREAYKSLDSARVLMTNTATGQVEQEFVFKYDEKDILLYSYKGKSEKSEYAQYSNGVEMFTYQNGETTYKQKGEEGFVLYLRGATHPQADEGLILYSPSAVTEAKVTEENGVTHIEHIYDAAQIGASTESGKVTGFSADYYFKGDELLYFVETTTAQEDGAEKVYSYKVEITDKNAVDKVENTVKEYENK
ncbi:MAG: hypothetical protein IKN17_06960 [Ruminococcus sp.]|nr:hypothetical protein [Ruminococcus sp.]